MNRRDRRLWREALTFADVGELTARWCEGLIQQTPGHCAPPDPETVPYLGLLADLNRTGHVVTTCSQAAGRREWLSDVQAWNAWVELFADRGWLTDQALPLALEGLHVREMPAGARREILGFYCDRVSGEAAADLRDARCVMISDPEPGRNDRLWPALAALAGAKEAAT